MNFAKGISVVVCCFNSARRLPETLAALAGQQNCQSFPLEIILVDNASTDDSAVVAKEIWESLGAPLPLRVVYESQPGLSSARKAGVLSAQYSYVVFVDDDNWLAEKYLAEAFQFMEKNLTVGVLGGCIHPVFEGDPKIPVWFWTYASGFAVGVQSDCGGDVSARGYLWGAGMVIRTAWLFQLYRRDYPWLLTGRSGMNLGSGDDSEICKVYLLAGYKIWYHDKLSLRHFIPTERQSLQYALKARAGFSAASPVLRDYDRWIAIAAARKTMRIRSIMFILKNMLSATRGSVWRSGNIRKVRRLITEMHRDGCGLPVSRR